MRTKRFETTTNKVFEVKSEWLGHDKIAQKLFRDLFVREGSIVPEFDGENSWKELEEQSQVRVVLSVSEAKTKIPLRAVNYIANSGKVKSFPFHSGNDRQRIFFPPTNVLSGFRVAFTGKGARYYGKSTMKNLVEYSGGLVDKKLSTNTDFLVIARTSMDVENSKILFAERNGVCALEPREFYAIWLLLYLQNATEEESSSIARRGFRLG